MLCLKLFCCKTKSISYAQMLVSYRFAQSTDAQNVTRITAYIHILTSTAFDS